MRRMGRRGMSLMEAMVAVSIVLVMGAVIGETMANAIEYQRILEERDVVIRQARVAMSKIKREVEQAYLTPSQLALETVQTVFVGMDDDPDTLYFATMAHQRIYRDSRECDQTEITLWAERADSEQGKGFVLYHREARRVDERPDEDGMVYPLAYNVRSFNLRYLDPVDNEWQEEWDTRGTDTPYRLPRSVEVGLVLIAPDPSDERRTVDVPFMTTINLRYGGRLMNTSNPLANRASQPLFGGNGNPQMPSPIANFQGFGDAQLPGARPTARPSVNRPGSRPPRSAARDTVQVDSNGNASVNPARALMGGKR